MDAYPTDQGRIPLRLGPRRRGGSPSGCPPTSTYALRQRIVLRIEAKPLDTVRCVRRKLAEMRRGDVPLQELLVCQKLCWSRLG